MLFIMKKLIYTASAALLLPLLSLADVAGDARALVDAGDYTAAASLLKDHVGAQPSAVRGDLAQLMGECLFFNGDFSASKPWFEAAKSKKIADAQLFLGRLAFLNYDFDRASELYSAFARSGRDAANPDADAELYERQLEAAEGFLDRVEDIVVIDSIAVGGDAFFRQYRLPQSAGRLMPPAAIPFEEASSSASMAFVSENGAYMVWGQPDDEGVNRLTESYLLTDGSWDTPHLLPESLNAGGDADYPFMMADGSTLYFAADGEESIGGLDIFVASRDAATGEFLAPANMGFPYNSPYDDYMLAIDEENAIGWWATDRNQLGDKVTIYVFAVNDLRRNLDPDNDDIVDRARLSSIADTRPDGVMIPQIPQVTHSAESVMEFILPMPEGKVYTASSQFRNRKAAVMMRDYVAAQRELAADSDRLASMRRQYADRPSPQLGAEIARLESKVGAERTSVRRMRSEVYRLELAR